MHTNEGTETLDCIFFLLVMTFGWGSTHLDSINILRCARERVNETKCICVRFQRQCRCQLYSTIDYNCIHLVGTCMLCPHPTNILSYHHNPHISFEENCNFVSMSLFQLEWKRLHVERISFSVYVCKCV